MTGILSERLPTFLQQKEHGIVDFLSLLEPTFEEIYDRAGSHHLLLDPATSPLPLVCWLSSWIATEIDAGVSEGMQRRMATIAARNFARRGTQASLVANLEAATGARVVVRDPGSVSVDPLPVAVSSDDVGARFDQIEERGDVDVRRGIAEPNTTVVEIEIEIVGGSVSSSSPASVRMVRDIVEREVAGATRWSLRPLEAGRGRREDEEDT